MGNAFDYLNSDQTTRDQQTIGREEEEPVTKCAVEIGVGVEGGRKKGDGFERDKERT
jgi:hypothetical protein